MSARTINIFLVTGFLGSGKTTFLRNVLEQSFTYPELKTGVLMNEFGSKNVDKPILPHNQISFLEINGGSIFCSCLHTEFIQALKEFYESTEINNLFVETSGLSNPSMIIQDVNIINNQIGDIYKIQKTICIVDASLIMKLLNVFTNITAQIEVSSYILLNKLDIVDSGYMDSIEQAINEINPNSKIFRTNFGKFNLEDLFISEKSPINAKFLEKRDEKGRLSSITLTQSNSVSEEGFFAYMRSIRESLIRVKGYIELDEQGWVRVDQVSDQLKIIPSVLIPFMGSLVLIFKDQIDEQKHQSEWKALESQ